MKVKSFYPFTLIVDGEEICLRIKRMEVKDHIEFRQRAARILNSASIRSFSRASSGPEQEQDEKGEYMIPLERIIEQRIGDMNPEQRTEYDLTAEADEAKARDFQRWVCEQFVTIERGLIEELADGTEQSVTDGADFARIFGARIDVLGQVVAAVRQENEMTVEEKKASRSPAASSRSSSGRRRGRAGQKQGTTAEPVVTEDSAGNGDATPKQTMLRQGRLSGSKETLPSNPVQSLD